MKDQLLVVGFLGCLALLYFAPVLVALFKDIDNEDLTYVVLMTLLGFLIIPWFMAMALALASPGNR